MRRQIDSPFAFLHLQVLQLAELFDWGRIASGFYVQVRKAHDNDSKRSHRFGRLLSSLSISSFLLPSVDSLFLESSWVKSRKIYCIPIKETQQTQLCCSL